MLETRFKIRQFFRRNHFKNHFTSERNSSHKMQLLSSSQIDSHSRTTNFAESLRLTQGKLASDFYTVRKLWMSSFECYKWYSISTFFTKRYVRTKEYCSSALITISRFLPFSKTLVLSNQMKWFSKDTYIHQFHSQPSIKILKIT